VLEWATTTTSPTYTSGYDGNRRRISTIDIYGDTTTMLYDGNGQVTKMIDALGVPCTTAYNPDGRVTGATDCAGFLPPCTTPTASSPMPPMAWATISYSYYDSLGRLTKQVDGAGDPTTFSYRGRAATKEKATVRRESACPAGWWRRGKASTCRNRPLRRSAVRFALPNGADSPRGEKPWKNPGKAKVTTHLVRTPTRFSDLVHHTARIPDYLRAEQLSSRARNYDPSRRPSIDLNA
jgi:YD repeat-containing protein